MFRLFLILCLLRATMHQPVGPHVSLEDGGTVWATLEEDGELAFENSFPNTAMNQESQVKKDVSVNLGQDQFLHSRIRII
jgi:hypothetical protein